ncbi:hypothetical protein PV350_40225, partial [Streptomyces sp. PA03-6a]|nr:hypothetical protein [Streptomyces sp. PA03-6a]
MKQGRFRHWHLLAEARRHLAGTLRGTPRPAGLDHRIAQEAPVHCQALTAPGARADRTVPAANRLYTTRS